MNFPPPAAWALLLSASLVSFSSSTLPLVHAVYLAPVGENWWGYMKSRPKLEMYAEDGAHASPAGSDFAAKFI
ncbi:MAG: hypothetical protein IKH57_13685 [Clostridia bacterium]|nr:hypothetical protein [Clostridia bacterium]